MLNAGLMFEILFWEVEEAYAITVNYNRNYRVITITLR